MKPFTTIAAVLLGIVALAHLYRVIQPFEVVIGGWSVPQWVSAVALIITGGISIMLVREARS
jgi:hypothetical protein